MKLYNQLKKWIYLKRARLAAKKYELDFNVGCVFDYQLKPYGYPKSGDICHIPMQSGRTAIYKAKVTKWWDGGTGQKSWRFEFQGYVEDTK